MLRARRTLRAMKTGPDGRLGRKGLIDSAVIAARPFGFVRVERVAK